MANDSPASILFDELGHPIGVLFDGYVYRIQTSSVLTDSNGNGPATVKPANTAAVAGDPALVVAISPNNSFTVNSSKSHTNTTATIAASLTNVQLLASNTIRLGATIFNDSSSGILFVKLGTTASSTDFTIKLYPSSYYEVPFGYTGEVDGIWTSTGGNARVGELT